MNELTDRQKATLLTVVADARDSCDSDRESVRAEHQPAIDALRADVQSKRDAGEESDAGAIEEQAQEYRSDLNCYCDVDRQIRVCEAVLATEMTDSYFEDFEIRARHDLPGSQYLAKSVTEQARAIMPSLLSERLDALRTERDEVKARLDARLT